MHADALSALILEVRPDNLLSAQNAEFCTSNNHISVKALKAMHAVYTLSGDFCCDFALDDVNEWFAMDMSSRTCQTTLLHSLKVRSIENHI